MAVTSVSVQSLLEGKFKLKEKIAVYVPATINVNETIDNTEYVEHAMITLAELFGGSTAQNVQGGWISDSMGLVKEKTTVVYAYAESLEADNVAKVIEFAEYLKITLSQDAIGLEVNGEFYLI